jgi:hypothetical protein
MDGLCPLPPPDMDGMLHRSVKELCDDLGYTIFDRKDLDVRSKVFNYWKEAFLNHAALRELYSFFPEKRLPLLPIEIWGLVKEYLGTPKYSLLSAFFCHRSGFFGDVPMHLGFLMPGKTWNQRTYSDILDLLSLSNFKDNDYVYIKETHTNLQMDGNDIYTPGV